MNIERLKQLQGNLTDQAFADKLGIHRVSWERIKNHRVPVSDKFLVRVHRVFPELNIFLPTDVATKDKPVAVINHNASQTAQDSRKGRLKTLWGGLVLGAKKLWQNSRKP